MARLFRLPVTVADYNSAGRQVAQVGQDGRHTTFSYDDLDRLTMGVENAGGSAPAEVTTTYGDDGSANLFHETVASLLARAPASWAAAWHAIQEGVNI